MGFSHPWFSCRGFSRTCVATVMASRKRYSVKQVIEQLNNDAEDDNDDSGDDIERKLAILLLIILCLPLVLVIFPTII